MFGWSTATFDRLLEKATSHLLLEPDWNAILQICDCIRQGDVQPKYAISATKKKLYAQNPHVVLYTLQVLESCVKNCGAPVHQEIAARSFMEELRELVKSTTNEEVKTRILELVQTWAHAFRNEPKYRAVQDTLNLLRMEGFKFPAMKESDAMFTADQAPEWADGDCCHRCRVQFSVVQRKHHCRNCGQIFCNKCSARSSPIPRFGIEKEVRVCEACWEKLNKPSATSSQKSSGSSSEQSSPHVTSQEGGKSEQELQEEEELQLAIALSKSEAESRDETPSTENAKKLSMTSTDMELDRYLNRSYWEQKQQKDEVLEARTSPTPSAPTNVPPTQTQAPYNPLKITEKYHNGEVDEMTDFLANLRTTLEIFVNRMKSNSSRGRPVANDSYVQSLFMNVTNMHSQLLKYIQEQDELRAHFEGLQDKLTQVRDARAALDALREEHSEHLRQEAEEAERQRQIQMAHKLEIMRKKKQEYLQYQRQLAIQRMQEQEREMQLRKEQHKQQYQVMHQGGPPPPLPSGVYPPRPGPYMPQPPPPVSQGYPAMHPPSNNGSTQPAFPVTYGPPQAPPGSPVSQLPSSEYQSFSMQNLSGTLPPISQGNQYSQPHVTVNSGTTIQQPGPPQNPMMSVPPGVMNMQQIGMMAGSQGPIMQQPPTATTTAAPSIPGMGGPQVAPQVTSGAPVAPPQGHEQMPQQQPQQPPCHSQSPTEALIVFD